MTRFHQPLDDRLADQPPEGSSAGDGPELGRRPEPRPRVLVAALEAAANAVVITNPAGRIIWVNRAFTRSTGYTASEAVGNTPSLLSSGVHNRAFFATLWDTILAGETWHGEITNRRKNGELYTEEMTVTPVVEADGEISHFIAIKQDVTERKRAEEEHARLFEAERLAHARAEEAVRAREEFLAVAAHELKTPITSLRGFAQLTLRQLDRGESAGSLQVRRSLRALDQQSEKLTRLVTQLLDVSRIDAGKLALALSVVDVGSLIEGVVATARDTAGEHALHLQLLGSSPALVDPLRLEQVVTNLLDNAIKFSPAGATIDIEVWAPEGGTISVAVRDRGPGIPPEHRERVFERFYQAHAPGHFPGMGLGLYISQQIVELHHGRLAVEFPADGGTRFVVTLPVGAGAAVPPAPTETVPVATGRVLLVDDDPGIRGLVEMVLADAGYTITTAADGEAALARVRQSAFDLILLDSHLPGMDGPAFARAYHHLPGPHAPIIALTGAAEPDQEAAAMGAASLLAKPFDIDDLADLTARYLRPAPAGIPHGG